MSKTKNILKKISYFLLQRKALKVVRNKSACNFQTAKSALILIDGLAKENSNVINQFLSFLKENSIEFLQIVYFDNKETVETDKNNGKLLFSKKNCNWLGKPNHQKINTLLEKEYDLLFDFSLKKYFFFEYITNLSKAKFKIGLFSDSHQYYDFMINSGENTNMKKFIDDVKHYLSNMK